MKKQKEINVKCGRFGCVWSKGKECEKEVVVLDTDGVCKSYESIEKIMQEVPNVSGVWCFVAMLPGYMGMIAFLYG